ncbi:uncharacterized protein YMR196W-like [Anneissia japonica]|uniref:uncharacterized protein YMR196W-like n=1 Tax=Anneissia japonica TaxID=1529436 RepID=UPI001425A8BF|nr:uncharacterized protein YMR196W-like [Anneissia japonica]
MSGCREKQRLAESEKRIKNWKRWGPYLSERQWGTVREDYSADGQCWDYFPHDDARSRVYRWGEDGLMGITDRECRLCFCVALWNGKDSILKERLFGLTGPQGNHGEDCKECYYYLDSTPSHSYMKILYKYPQEAYPYSRLVNENASRGISKPELELEDTGVFDEKRYWDVFTEYAKNGPNDILCRITVANRGPDTATIHVLPQLWYRNTWIWGCSHEGCTMKPKMSMQKDGKVLCSHESLDKFYYVCDVGPDGKNVDIHFTENETNMEKLYDVEHYTKFFRDAFHRYIIEGEVGAVDARQRGTKCAPIYVLEVPGGEERTVKVRLFSKDEDPGESYFGDVFDQVFADRIKEADAFYATVIPSCDPEKTRVARQAYASLLWSKQFYHYIVKDWLQGDKDQPPPPESRHYGRNIEWKHLFNRDIVSMPDKWEYPWYASWDLAFHMIPFARVDPDFAKQQLLMFLREWYMAPNGQMPAYEFAFGDVNPPVHAWAVFRVFKMTGERGERDRVFLARCFQKLLLNFTWWVNRKDPDGKNIFSGGFLGLDNIGVFDRSRPLPTGGSLEQADGTAWVAFFCVVMLDISLELARTDPSYEDMASKFFEHFVSIVDAMNQMAGGGGLWDDEDGFYYDVLRTDNCTAPMRIRSMVGLVPLFASLTLEESVTDKMPGFKKRLEWFMKYRTDLSSQISYMTADGEVSGRHLLGIPNKKKLKKVLAYLLDEDEFLSQYGIRSLSKAHADKPFSVHVGNEEYRVDYVPGESSTYLFGGNSNWRGPIWLCVNYLIIEALERYDYFYGEAFKVECPTGSGKLMCLKECAKEISRRLSSLFLPDENGRRPCHGQNDMYKDDPNWKDLILFYEYFHGDNGRGCGASHQTGWTAVVVNCLERVCKS